MVIVGAGLAETLLDISFAPTGILKLNPQDVAITVLEGFMLNPWVQNIFFDSDRHFKAVEKKLPGSGISRGSPLS